MVVGEVSDRVQKMSDQQLLGVLEDLIHGGASKSGSAGSGEAPEEASAPGPLPSEKDAQLRPMPGSAMAMSPTTPGSENDTGENEDEAKRPGVQRFQAPGTSQSDSYLPGRQPVSDLQAERAAPDAWWDEPWTSDPEEAGGVGGARPPAARQESQSEKFGVDMEEAPSFGTAIGSKSGPGVNPLSLDDTGLPPDGQATDLAADLQRWASQAVADRLNSLLSSNQDDEERTGLEDSAVGLLSELLPDDVDARRVAAASKVALAGGAAVAFLLWAPQMFMAMVNSAMNAARKLPIVGGLISLGDDGGRRDGVDRSTSSNPRCQDGQPSAGSEAAYSSSPAASPRSDAPAMSSQQFWQTGDSNGGDAGSVAADGVLWRRDDDEQGSSYREYQEFVPSWTVEGGQEGDALLGASTSSSEMTISDVGSASNQGDTSSEQHGQSGRSLPANLTDRRLDEEVMMPGVVSGEPEGHHSAAGGKVPPNSGEAVEEQVESDGAVQLRDRDRDLATTPAAASAGSSDSVDVGNECSKARERHAQSLGPSTAGDGDVASQVGSSTDATVHSDGPGSGEVGKESDLWSNVEGHASDLPGKPGTLVTWLSENVQQPDPRPLASPPQDVEKGEDSDATRSGQSGERGDEQLVYGNVDRPGSQGPKRLLQELLKGRR
ncbi:unnamed protein product [Ostreobium quekettii]|uniref:Uncharacterized protein n=1 Tax=Ostreobium quekettii TaxID=121088 RepID=A0A8S1IYX4_9CHLO|nr:unnamed protein product [Ostreobium quekettii]